MSFNAIITANVKGLETGVDKAGQAIDKLAKTASEKIADIGKSFEDVGKKASIFSAGMVAAGAAIFALTKKIGDFASSLLSASVALDATTDMMQQYKLVAIEAGTSANAFDRSTEALVRRLKDVNTEGDNTGDIIRRLGVSLTDASGGMRKTGDVSDDIIKSLADMGNASERNILASQLFGRSWVELAPILDMGSEAIENIKGSANDLGIVLGEDSLNAANNFNVAVEKMKLQAEAMTMQLGAKLAPVLEQDLLPILENFIIPAVSKFADKTANLAERFRNLDPETKKLIAILGGVAVAIGPVLFAVGKIIAIAPAVGTAFTVMTGPIGLAVAALAALAAAVLYVWDNWDAIIERISDIGWWKNALIGMVQFFIENNVFSWVIKAYNAMVKKLGGSGVTNPFETWADGLEELKVETKEYENEFGSFMDAVKSGMSLIPDLFDSATKSADEATEAAERTAVAVATIPRESNIEPIVGAGITMLEVEPVVVPPIDYDPYAQSLEEMNAITLDYGGIIANGLTDFASSIGEAFASGNFEGLGDGLIGAMGSMMSQFGSMLIASAIASEALQSLITNPWTALAAGIALVALGAAATASANATVSKTTGGGGGGSMGGTNSYNKTSQLGDSSYRGAYKDDWNNEVVFKIGNNELVGTLDRANTRRERL